MRTRQAELAELVEAGAQQIIGALRAACSEGLSVLELTDLLGGALRRRNQIDAAVTCTIGAVDAAAAQAKEAGELTMGLSCANWLAHTLHISSSAAHAQVRLARQLPSMPATAAAFERGELSPQHATVVARSVEHGTRGGGDAGRAERLLLREAGARDPRDLLRYGLGLLHRLAPQEMEAEEERRHRLRYLRVAEVFDGGCEVEGYLDEIAGARLKTALDGVMGRRVRGEERTPGQRRADALDEIVTSVLDAGELPVRGGQRPHLTITASLETLRADPGAPAALLDWGMPISAKALRRIASDAEITPILLSSSGDPLHVGRKYRTATLKMRKALAERDRRCVWPGCDRPPEQAQADHVRPWAQGGKTDIEQMRLLCGVHNRRLTRGWRLEALPDHRYAVHPPKRPGQPTIRRFSVQGAGTRF
jgi:Domain of unknown function (DUF222)/HNH endonuclease